MFLFVLQNAALLIFAGIGAYAIFSNANLRENRNRRQIMIGLVMGVMVFLITSDAQIIEGVQAPLDGKTGLLVYAGYLGGPVGGLIAAVFGAVFRIHIGGPNVWIGVSMYAVFALYGALVSRLCPSPSWPQVPKKAIGLLLAGSLVLQFLPAPIALWDGSADPAVSFAAVGVALAMAGVLSTTVMSILIHYAYVAASVVHESDENARRLKLAAKAANLGVFERVAGNDYVLFDDGMYNILGLDKNEGKIHISDWMRLIFPEDHPLLKAVFTRVWKGNPPDGPTTFRIVRPDGVTRNVQAHWTTESGDDGAVRKVIGIYEDVTVSVETQLEKARAETRLARIIENLPGALHSLEVEPDGRLKLNFASRYCREIWGYASEELMAQPSLFEERHDSLESIDLLAVFRHAAETLQPIYRRFAITTIAGEHKWLDIHASASQLPNGSRQIDCIFIDVTGEVIARDQLEVQMQVAYQAQKIESIGQLTGGVAHDFNNLLSVIMGNLEQLRDELSGERHRQLIDAGIAATLRGADLTHAMLAFARKASLCPSTFDVNKLVRDTTDWTGRTLPASIDIQTSLQTQLWPVLADVSLSESALLNLILNARDAMESGGTLTIETANVLVDKNDVLAQRGELEPGRYVVVSVSDTGHGIPSESLDEIFEPFFTTKSLGKGSGLGLSMIQGFMRQSGGIARVCSKVGKGTTFKLFFVAAENGSAQSLTSTDRRKEPSRSGRILVAEDQEEVLRVIVTFLEKAGYEVTSARSGDEAKCLFEADPNFNLLLTDITMPGQIQGTALAGLLRKLDPNLSVVFLSGYAIDGAAGEHGLHPSDIRLSKPILREKLLAAVATSMDRKT